MKKEKKMEFLDKIPPNQSGNAKEMDQKELNNLVINKALYYLAKIK